jgi:two-component system OmpR family response regulator
LLARLRAVLRRSSNSVVSALRCRDVVLEPAGRIVKRGGQEVSLSAHEYHTLLALMQRMGHTVSRDQLEVAVYGSSGTIESNTVAVYIHQLRRKLGDGLIETQHGLGYRMVAGATP